MVAASQAVVAASGAPLLHGKKKANELSPPGIMCNLLVTIFKQDLQDSASTVAVSGKNEAEGWCSDPQLFWMLLISGR